MWFGIGMQFPGVVLSQQSVTTGGSPGGLLSDTTLRMSHMSAGRPYVTFLAPAETNADGFRRLHIKTFADSAS